SAFVPPHSVEATEVFTGMSTEDALAVAGAAAVEQTGSGPVPQYEVWRPRIRAGFEAAAAGAPAARRPARGVAKAVAEPLFAKRAGVANQRRGRSPHGAKGRARNEPCPQASSPEHPRHPTTHTGTQPSRQPDPRPLAEGDRRPCPSYQTQLRRCGEW